MSKNTVKSSQKNVVAESDELGSLGSEAAYEKWLDRARMLPASVVIPMRADVILAVHNAGIGAASLAACTAGDRAKLPKTNFSQLARVPEIGSALLFSNRLIDRGGGPSGVLETLKVAQSLRALMLGSAEVLVTAGKIPEKEVARIRAGHGMLDAANDCVDLAALFKKYRKAIKGMHPVTDQQIKDAATVGTQLQSRLKPSRAKRPETPADVKQATDDRDRLWTLLVQAHEEMWRAGAYLFGSVEVAAKVPALMAHQGGKQTKKTASGGLTATRSGGKSAGSNQTQISNP